MFLSEADAKKKWCPFSRAHDGENRIGNEVNMTPTGTNCIGSRCMVWRWNEGPDFTVRATEEFRRTGRRLAPEQGYCGLVEK